MAAEVLRVHWGGTQRRKKHKMRRVCSLDVMKKGWAVVSINVFTW